MTNEELAKFSGEMAVSAAKEILKEPVKLAKKGKDKLSNTLRLGFNTHLTDIYSRCSVTKTILYGNTPVELTKIYQSCNLQSDDKILSDDELVDNLIQSQKNYIISGTAGSGKSMLMKYITCSAIRKQSKKIPLFFEFRNANKNKSKTLIDHIWQEFHYTVKNFKRGQFDDAMKKGIFVFILDGFDELDNDIKNDIEIQSLDLCRSFPLNSFVISSRPDERLNANQDFDVYYVQPMSKYQVVSLIKKLDYDIDLQNSFINKIKTELYDKHMDFLSSPLLATMMLLTYSQFANVPEKIHIFYSQVYEVLFSRHDVKKGGNYTRDFKTNLAMDDFSLIFQVFSFFSYLQHELKFPETRALKLCDSSIKHSGLTVKKQDYLHDLLRSVCLLVRDGNNITYSHRSFQEYFSALFILSFDDELFIKSLSEIEPRIQPDNVFSLIFGIDKERLERLYIAPKLDDLLGHLKAKTKKQKAEKILRFIYPGMVIGTLENGTGGQRHRVFKLDGITHSIEFESQNKELGFSVCSDFSIICFIMKLYEDDFKIKEFSKYHQDGSNENGYMFALLIAKGGVRVEVSDGQILHFDQFKDDILRNRKLVSGLAAAVESFERIRHNITRTHTSKKDSILSMLK